MEADKSSRPSCCRWVLLSAFDELLDAPTVQTEWGYLHA